MMQSPYSSAGYTGYSVASPNYNGQRSPGMTALAEYLMGASQMPAKKLPTTNPDGSPMGTQSDALNSYAPGAAPVYGNAMAGGGMSGTYGGSQPNYKIETPTLKQSSY